MRKTLLATSALVAAIAFAGAASAQNVHSYPYQVNNARQESNLNISNVAVGHNLTGSATSIGNIIDVTSVIGQGIAEVNVGTGLGTGPQTNNGQQSSSVSVFGVAAPGVTKLASTAAGNVTNIEGNLVTQRGNGTFSQTNNGYQNANLNIHGSSYGSLSATSGAVGNSLLGEGQTVLLTPAASSAATIANYIPTAVLGQDQVNNSGQHAQMHIGDTSFNSADFRAQAVGNSTSIDATVVANVGGHQTNNGFQSSYVGLNAVHGIGQTDLTSVAIGNSTAAEAPTVTAYGGAGVPDHGTQRGDSSIRQVNNAGQSADFAVGQYYFPNGGEHGGHLDRVNGSAVAIGNILSLAGGSVTVHGDHSQVNNAHQSASARLSYVNAPGSSELTSQAVGNILSVDTTGSSSVSFSQTNNHGSNANINVSNAGFGTLNASSLSMGNNVSIVAPTGFVGGINQTNNGGAYYYMGDQVARTTIGSASFSNLTAGAASIGNSFSVTTSPTRP